MHFFAFQLLKPVVLRHQSNDLLQHLTIELLIEIKRKIVLKSLFHDLADIDSLCAELRNIAQAISNNAEDFSM